MNIKISFINLILIFILISIQVANGKIVYEKGNIIITEYELNTYLNIYKNTYGKKIKENEAIKNIVLMNNTISYISANNPAYIDIVDSNIAQENSNIIEGNIVLLNFLRFIQIRNQFIYDYFNNDLSVDDLKETLDLSDELNFSYSENNCLTVKGLVNKKNYPDIHKIIYKKLKNMNSDIYLEINEKTYQLCIDTILLKKLENSLFKVIENKTKKGFKSFVYENFKKKN